LSYSPNSPLLKKKQKNQKNIFRKKPKNNSRENRIPEHLENCQNWWRRFKNINIEFWQYILTDESPVDKENSI
jgi:hypothetical protein